MLGFYIKNARITASTAIISALAPFGGFDYQYFNYSFWYYTILYFYFICNCLFIRYL